METHESYALILTRKPLRGGF